MQPPLLRWKPEVMYKVIILHLTFTSQRDEVSTRRTLSHFTTTELSERAPMWNVQHRTDINCFQGIFQISNLQTLLHVYRTGPQKAFCKEKNHKATLFGKGAFLRASDAETGGFPAHAGTQKTAEIISFLWAGVWSGCMNFKCCLLGGNECYNGLLEWTCQRQDLLTETLFCWSTSHARALSTRASWAAVW